VKIEDPNEKIFILGGDEFIIDVACGALFTVALSNKGRVFVTGLIGGGPLGTLEEQLDKTRFKELEFNGKVTTISAGLSGAGMLTSEGAAYIWGRFGKIVINVPQKVEREKKGLGSSTDLFSEVRIGDECAFALTNRG
jgi:alpha-tubulin suppressor-like RCC1 family protein